MKYADVTRAAFLDELEKIAAAKRKFVDATKTRAGRRPMSVSTMLKKEKDGTLFGKSAEGSLGTIIPFSTTDPQDGAAAKAPRRDEGEVPSREDGREQASTKIPAGSRYTMAPAGPTTDPN